MPEQHAQQARRPHHHHHHPRHHTEWFRFISGALPADTFHVVRFTGTEGLNKLFSFRLELVSAKPDVDTGKVLAARARFVILREDAPPAVFHGYPSKVEQGGHFGDHTSYTVELQPAFRKLADLRHSAVFLRQTAQDAARELLRSLPFFKLEHEFRLTRKYPEREFAMQYDESLFDYILFRMEEQGAYFYFAPDEDRLIFADGPLSHERADLDLAYSPPSGLDHNIREEILHSFTLSHTPLPRQVVLRCYDWKDPKRVIVGRAEVDPEGVGDVYLAGENAESEEEAQRLAQIRAEERLCRGRVFTGASSSPLLRPGVVFNLTNHYNPTFNRAYLVTEITHEGAQEAYISLGLGLPVKEGSDHLFYRNGFTCIPSDVPYRPARTAPRAKIAGVLRAFVDGTQNKRAEMDDFGRYKLIFPFDLSGRSGGKASCWIRMAGPQAGMDSGMAFPLLPGTEVVVSFIDGDPDRPIITGSVANGETGALSGRDNANFSGVRSVGGNQLTFNDSDNQQSITLNTASGQSISVGDSPAGVGNFTLGADYALTAATAGTVTMATLSQDAVAGFKISQKTSTKTKDVLINIGKTLGSGTVMALDSLSKRSANYALNEKDLTKEQAGTANIVAASSGMAADLGKGILSLLPLISSFKDPVGLYGVTLSASKEESAANLQVEPSKGAMIAAITSLLLSRGAAALADATTGGVQIFGISQKHGGKDQYERADYAAASRHFTSAVADCVPAFTALIALCAAKWKMSHLTKNLGGVSISSEDSNVNIRAKEPVSLHSQTGILLDTSHSVEDAETWGVRGQSGAFQVLRDLWTYNGGEVTTPTEDVITPPTPYVVVNTKTLGLFAKNHAEKTEGFWVSEAPTHILKSDTPQQGDPKAQVQIKKDGGVEVQVTDDDIGLAQGPDGGGRRFRLTQDTCFLANGDNVNLTLTDAKATLEAEGSSVGLEKNKAVLKGEMSEITCNSGGITLDAGNGEIKFANLSWKDSSGALNYQGGGALKIDGDMIKIG